jgi:glycine/D-amino acid oxidase-like deaminating enzyme
VVERRAGALLVEPCLRTMLQLARGHGADLRTRTRVVAWHADAGSVTIRTMHGTLHARQLVIAAGAWLNAVLRMEVAAPPAPTDPPPVSQEWTHEPLQLPVAVERQVPHWFAPAAGRTEFSAAVCPVTVLEYAPGRYIYTLPDLGGGVKAGIHHQGALVDADNVDLTVSMDDEVRLRALLESWMPGAAERVLHAEVCLYTNTPDHHFLVDFHPSHENVLLLSACSGHGFKFAPAVAEVVADLLVEGGSWIDVAEFGVGRLTAS